MSFRKSCHMPFHKLITPQLIIRKGTYSSRKRHNYLRFSLSVFYPINLSRMQPRSQGSLLPVPTERERERPWLGLVTWSQNKINSEGGVLCLSIFWSGSFSPSRDDRKGKTDLLSLQLYLKFGKFLPKQSYHQINKRITSGEIKKLVLSQLNR